jgi:hypothetical protein
MDLGKVEYVVFKGGGRPRVRLRLTLIGQGDDDVLRREGLAALRRKRILRLAREAERQGVLLGYRDLSGLLFTSLSTLKRDVKGLEDNGVRVPVRGKRKNGGGNGDSGPDDPALRIDED